MLIQIDKKTIDNQDVRSAISTLRHHGMHPFEDGYYRAYITEDQLKSLESDPKIQNVNQYAEHRSPAASLPAIYGCKFYKTHHNHPAMFYGSHLPANTEVELVEVNP
jgi:hypothetical protein